MSGIERRADGRDGRHVRQLGRGGQCRGASQAVPDQQARRGMPLGQGMGRGDEIARGPLALAKAGAIEAQDSDALARQRACDAHRGRGVLDAGEAVREQRVRLHRPFRQVQAA